ncbi:glycosyltransferase family 2 protein [Isobaculum melis]|uniref:Glycosyltransferase involved in cell wall bisynthesis n=1 Tax=Isobaculum melis TaxID=142588 RepID=A0A1H9QPA1_9LACT|nr:glycosyltransferase family 2 protein [Isobaculum melis]SER62278.1 Glycosyltransferase involved in cell wall bisynthesis [Isobaculum melis]
MKKITICSPMYNEAENIVQFYDEVSKILAKISDKYDYEFLFINDGSLDESLNIVEALREKDARVNFVDLSRNYGKEIAMAAGFDYATGDAMIIMDTDLQHPPAIILEMIKEWENGYQDVYGKRRERPGESWLKRKTSSYYYKILQKFSNVPVLPGVGDFRLLDRVCIEGIKKLRESQRYTKGMYMWVGYRKKEVLFDAEERFAGETKWKWSSLINLAIDGITSNTIMPLRITSFVGAVISIISFFYMIYIFCSTLFFGISGSGFPTLIITILFLGGLQLLFLGIIGEYIGKIFIEVKRRPIYLIQKYSGEKDFEKTGDPDET